MKIHPSASLLTYFACAVISVVIMLRIQPPQGQTRKNNGVGLAVLLDVGDGRCLHLHHWILCLFAFFIILTIAHFKVTPLVAGICGALVGIGASDLAYNDLSLLRKCTISAEK